MNILIITGPLFPQPGNNAKLIGKLLPYLRKEHSVQILAPTAKEQMVFADTIWGVPVHWARDERTVVARKLLDPVVTKAVDRNGYSDYIAVRILMETLEKLKKQYPFEAVITTSEPFPAAAAGARLSGVKKILYIMDPPESIRGDAGTAYRTRTLPVLLEKYDSIITTPFIQQALVEHGYRDAANKTTALGFPMIEDHGLKDSRIDDGHIHLLFCGWLYSEIRSPKYFLDIITRLDERFVITFMGRECEKLRERFEIKTRAEIITLPNQPYAIALQAMQDADILVNIGNSVPVHMPSKTLEYINTGKPFVNFYKMKDCPTLYYTKRYPLCLNLFEGDDVEAAAERFEAFCLTEKGKTVDRAWIEAEYRDCTPEYIAGKILEKLGE